MRLDCASWQRLQLFSFSNLPNISSPLLPLIYFELNMSSFKSIQNIESASQSFYEILIFTIVIINMNICEREPLEYWGKNPITIFRHSLPCTTSYTVQVVVQAALLSIGSCTVFPHHVIALTLNHCTSHQVALKCIFAQPRSCILWIAMCRGDICVYLHLIFVFVFL